MRHRLPDLPRVGVRPQLRPALRLRDAPGSLRIILELYWLRPYEVPPDLVKRDARSASGRPRVAEAGSLCEPWLAASLP
eukprot:8801057-Alexandrium_andersonii.AAC.2